MMNRTNSSFLRRSGVRNALAKAPSTASSLLGLATAWTDRDAARPELTPSERDMRLSHDVCKAAGSLTGAAQSRTEDGARTSRRRGHRRAAARPDRAVRGRAQTTVARPPAASIFSLAEAENAWALTWTATERSPWPRTLTGWPLRTAPLATRSSTRDVAALGEQLAEPVEVDDLVLDAERVLEALQLRQPHVHRHLAALEATRAPGSGPWCPWCHGRRSCPWSPHRDPHGSSRSWRPGRGAGDAASDVMTYSTSSTVTR